MRPKTSFLVGGVTLLVAASISGRSPDLPIDRQIATTSTPAYCNTAHNVGKIALTVGNSGLLGTGGAMNDMDCFTGAYLPSCEYPIGSNSIYLWAASLWVGAVVGEDTLVSTGFNLGPGSKEFHPDASPTGDIDYRSILNPTSPAYEGAVSEQDFVARYTDTCLDCLVGGNDPWDNRPHLPLGIEVTQHSYAWGHPYIDDFVLFDYVFHNLGTEPLSELYVGLLVDGDVGEAGQFYNPAATDDITGFLAAAPNPLMPDECRADFQTQLAWIADNDGDLASQDQLEVPHVTGMKFLGQQPSSKILSYNWWYYDYYAPTYDFGPQTRVNYRIFPWGGTGTPYGDPARYFMMSNGEIDYDQFRTATIGGVDPVWPPPPFFASSLAQGFDTRYVISLGPFEIAPGDELSIPMAYVAGEDLHSDPTNISNLPDNPDAYEANLEFSNLITNAVRAEWVYDNPGVDSDGDGYAGEYYLCDGDTIWVRGDGVPDWRLATAPKTAALWVEPRPFALWLRWNGFEHETAVNPVSSESNFEGYRAYLSTTGTLGSYAQVASYDIEDYVRFAWDTTASDWSVSAARWTLEAARCWYAPGGCEDPDWHPLDYPREQPFVMSDHPDSVFYFEPLGLNACRLGLETPFKRRFPDAIPPPYSNPEAVPIDSGDTYLTADGFFKYYEYEYLLDNLLPNQQYWIVVTAFDYGGLITGALALESGLAPEALVARPLADPNNCCEGLVGNVDCDPSDEVNVGDLAILIDHLYIDRRPLCCPAEADLNQSGGESPANEAITIGDVAHLIDYLFISGEALPSCL